jgi:hypothetical protein
MKYILTTLLLAAVATVTPAKTQDSANHNPGHVNSTAGAALD